MSKTTTRKYCSKPGCDNPATLTETTPWLCAECVEKRVAELRSAMDTVVLISAGWDNVTFLLRLHDAQAAEIEHWQSEAKRLSADLKSISKLATGDHYARCSWCDAEVDRNGQGEHAPDFPTNLREMGDEATN